MRVELDKREVESLMDGQVLVRTIEKLQSYKEEEEQIPPAALAFIRFVDSRYLWPTVGISFLGCFFITICG